MELRKLLGWMFMLGLIGYVVFSIIQGGGTESPTGEVVATPNVPATGDQAEVLKFPECMDTDDGKNYDLLGHTYNTREGGVYDDYCEDGQTLVEYFCNNEYPDRINVPCDCFKGACRDS